jgi:hypothetical protein
MFEPAPTKTQVVLLEEFRCLQLLLQILSNKDGKASIMAYDDSDDPDDDHDDPDDVNTLPLETADLNYDNAKETMLLTTIATILVRNHEILAVAASPTRSETNTNVVVTANPDRGDTFFTESHNKWTCILLPRGTSHLPSLLSNPWHGLYLQVFNLIVSLSVTYHCAQGTRDGYFHQPHCYS